MSQKSDRNKHERPKVAEPSATSIAPSEPRRAGRPGQSREMIATRKRRIRGRVVHSKKVISVGFEPVVDADVL